MNLILLTQALVERDLRAITQQANEFYVHGKTPTHPKCVGLFHYNLGPFQILSRYDSGITRRYINILRRGRVILRVFVQRDAERSVYSLHRDDGGSEGPTYCFFLP
jgi:hypothetical protein